MAWVPDRSKLIKFHLGNFLSLWYELGTTLFLTEFSGWWYAVSYAFALITAVLFLFVYFVCFVFDVAGHSVKRLRNFIFLTSAVYACSWFLVVLITEKSNLHYIGSILIVGAFIALFTYHLNEYLVFYD